MHRDFSTLAPVSVAILGDGERQEEKEERGRTKYIKNVNIPIIHRLYMVLIEIQVIDQLQSRDKGHSDLPFR